MKTIRHGSLVFGMALGCAAMLPIAGGASAGEMVTLKAVCAWPTNSDSCSQGLRLIKAINDAAKGKIEIKVLGGPEVVRAPDDFQAMRSGIIDMAISSATYYGGEDPESNAFSLVKGSLSKREYLEASRHSGAMEIINKVYNEKSHVHFVGETNCGESFYFMMSKPVRTLADMKGMSLRTTGPAASYAVKQLGMNPVNMPPSELYPALQRGIVQGAYRNPNDAWSQGEKGLYKTIVEPPLDKGGLAGLYIAESKWSQMPADLRALVTKTALDLQPAFYDHFANATKEAAKEYEKEGVKTVKLPHADAAKMVHALNGYWSTIISQSPTYGPKLKAVLAKYTE
jgi:TRAP-type transport system periplasmic protein